MKKLIMKEKPKHNIYMRVIAFAVAFCFLFTTIGQEALFAHEAYQNNSTARIRAIANHATSLKSLTQAWKPLVTPMYL